jgi:hypothetical protein
MPFPGLKKRKTRLRFLHSTCPRPLPEIWGAGRGAKINLFADFPAPEEPKPFPFYPPILLLFQLLKKQNPHMIFFC